MKYIQREFQFQHLNQARLGDSAHLHVYELQPNEDGSRRLELASRLSTDADGIARSLGLQANPKMELEAIMAILRSKLSERTLFTLQ